MRGGGWVVLLCGFLTAPCVAGAPGAEGAAAARSALPGLEQMVASPRDLWGEAAMREPNGASYEFFEKLLPPPRYVNADFRYYPIVLSGPGASVKARLVSNGSGVNLRGGARSWNDVGTPLVFRVGPDEFCFGAVPDRLSHPTLAEGYLPIVEIRYQHASPVQAEGSIPLRQTQVDRVPEVYCLEAFASTDPALADNAMVFVRFSLVQGARGVVAVQADAKSPVTFARGKMTDEQGRVLACFDGRWHWERQRAVAALVPGVQATLAIATKPLEGAASLELAPDAYERHRKACAATWQQILDSGMSLDCPEPRVNDAWRNLIVQDFSLLHGDRIHYSAGNQYDKLYEAEGSDAALAMMLWGYEDEMRRMIVPLLDFTRKGLEFHQAGLKINYVCRLYWQTRDAGLVESLRPRWEKELRRILEGRTRPHGLLPKEQYCGDVRTPVHSLRANAKAWRAVRDLGAVLADLGRGEEAERLARAAAEYHRDILAALKQSVRRDTVPPFVPIAHAPHHGHADRSVQGAHDPPDPAGQTHQIDLGPAARRTDHDLRALSVPQAEGLQDLDRHADLHHGVARHADADRVADPLGQQGPQGHGRRGPGVFRQAGVGQSKVDGIVEGLGDRAVGLDRADRVAALDTEDQPVKAAPLEEPDVPPHRTDHQGDPPGLGHVVPEVADARLVDPDPDGRAVGPGRVDDPEDRGAVPDVARIEADLGCPCLDGLDGPLRAEVDVRHHGDADPPDNAGQGCGVGRPGHGHAHDLAAGSREPPDLPNACVHVRGRDLGHGLDHDGGPAPDADRAHLDRASLAPWDHAAIVAAAPWLGNLGERAARTVVLDKQAVRPYVPSFSGPTRSFTLCRTRS